MSGVPNCMMLDYAIYHIVQFPDQTPMKDQPDVVPG